MLITTNEGFPYPQSSDFASLPVHMANFANAYDAKVPAWDTAFITLAKNPAFVFRSSADSIAIAFNAGAVNIKDLATTIWNNAGVSVSGPFVNFAPGDVNAWWFVGCHLIVSNGGTVTTGRLNQGIIQPSWPGYGSPTIPGPQPAPITVVTYPTPTGAIYGTSVETNQGGEPVQAQGLLRTFGSTQLTVLLTHNDNGAGATRTIKAGSALWGIRLGNA